MNLIGHRDWRSNVLKFYGGVSNFRDASTIRIRLEFLREHTAEEFKMRDLLTPHPEDLASWLGHSEPELQEAMGYITELENWLDNRNLVAR